MSGYPLREHIEDLRIKMAMGKVPETCKTNEKVGKRIGKNGSKKIKI